MAETLCKFENGWSLFKTSHQRLMPSNLVLLTLEWWWWSVGCDTASRVTSDSVTVNYTGGAAGDCRSDKKSIVTNYCKLGLECVQLWSCVCWHSVHVHLAAIYADAIVWYSSMSILNQTSNQLIQNRNTWEVKSIKSLLAIYSTRALSSIA